ncbi:MAG: ATP-grasp domain-containing protein [Muribaculaceae bacterium]|nr:ATP-grasp domain-containing protein [Muribaculaceae bacterium]
MTPADFNVLFLGGAKRVSMARLFKKAAADMGLKCNIFSYEMSTREAIACEATVIEGLRWSDPAVDGHLRGIIQKNAIKAVVPFVDGAVAVAARLADVTFAPCCTPDKAEQMFDKVVAATLFEKVSLPKPATYVPGEPSLMLIAKPRHGSASQGIVEIRSLEQLDTILGMGDKYLIQERIDRREEYTVDCYASVADGHVLVASPRRRLQVAGGEVTKTVTVDMPELKALSAEAITRLDLRGAVTVQFMRDLDDNRLLLMEINPRLGGGAVCSVLAGADIPSLIIHEALGMPLHSPEVQAGVEIARYPAETVFYPEKS